MIIHAWTYDELVCIDTGGMENVVTDWRWRLTSTLTVGEGEQARTFSLTQSEGARLGPPDPENFVTAPAGVTPQVVRQWVGHEADALEAILEARLIEQATGPTTSIFTPATAE